MNGASVSRRNKNNTTDVTFSEDEAIAAFGRVWGDLIRRIDGDPWKLSKEAIEEFRQKKYPNLLEGVE